MRNTVFLDYDQDELDRAYDQRAWAANAESLIAAWQAAAPGVRSGHSGYRECGYGDAPEERLDIYPCSVLPAPIHIHLHGGAWRAQSKEDGAFAAGAMTAAGMHFLLPEFGRLPAVRMPDVVGQLARALGWIHRNADAFGGDRDRIVLSGHSSGAHLAAVLATLDWRAHGLPADIIKALVCISGAYDLEAVLLSARSRYIELSPEEADRLSPPRHAGSIACPVWLLYGGRETPEFVRQGRAFAEALSSSGRLAACIEVTQANHFEIADQMADTSSAVFSAVREALAGAQAARREAAS